MEKAIHITNLNNLKYFNKGEFQRIYWGVEFCQNLIPAIKDTEKILEFAKENGLKITFVTPFVTTGGLKKLNESFLWFKKRKIACEVVVNDYGILESLYSNFDSYFTVVLGRLLVKQQRDPAMKTVIKKQLPFAIRGKDGKISIIAHRPPKQQYQKGIKASYINSSAACDFLSKFGIKRVELNNLIQGLNLKGIGFKKSIYTPYVHISTSRFCPMESRFQKINRINVCHKECQRYYDILRNRAMSRVIYKRGNTTFYKNSVDTRKIGKIGIDRLVFQPELPF